MFILDFRLLILDFKRKQRILPAGTGTAWSRVNNGRRWLILLLSTSFNLKSQI